MALDDRADFRLLDDDTQQALRKLAETSADGPDAVDFSADLATSRLLFLSGRFGGRTRGTPDNVARRFLQANAGLFGIERDLSGLGEPIVTTLESGSVVRLPQSVGKVRVFGSGIRVEVDPRGTVTTVCGRTVDGADAPSEPPISQTDAILIARDTLCLRDSVELQPELVLTDVQTGTDVIDASPLRAAWLVSLEGPESKVDLLIDGVGDPVVVVTPTGETDVEQCPSDVPLVHVNPVTGVPDFVTFGPNGTRTSGSASGDPARAALAFFSDHPLMFGTGDVPNQLWVQEVLKDPGAPFQAHVILQQMYGGLEVMGAELRVHLSQSLNVTSIGGNYLRNPRVVPEARVLQFEARDTAVQEVGKFRTLRSIPGDPAKDVQDDGLVVFPGELTKAPYARNAVAWRFRFPEATVLVDAESTEILGGLLFAYPHHLGADRNILDALGASEISFPTLVMHNSTPVGATAPNAEVPSADAFLGGVLGFYAGFGRASWDGKDSPGEIVTNSLFVVTPANPAHWDIFRQQAWFQMGMISAQSVGHEFTHGVTMATAGLMPIDEQGALNEHYSDVMGGLSIRSLAAILTTPSTYSAYVPRSAACAGPTAVLTSACDSGNVHTNNAIGNMAATLLGLGNGPVGTHKGVGFNRLGRLFFDTLTTRMHPWSTYVDERLNTWETARTLAARGVLVVDDANPMATLDFVGTADEVSWAFKAVGVDPALIPGWFAVPGSPAGQHTGAMVPWWTGQSMPACTLVGDIEMQVRVFDPLKGSLPWWEGRSRVNGPGAGAVTFPGGVLGASIVSHGVGTASKETVTTYFHSGFLPFEHRPEIIPIDDPACPPPAPGGPRPQSEFITPGKTHWNDFGLGGKGTDQLNFGLAREPGGAGCMIDLIELELLDRNGQILFTTQLGSPPAVQHFGIAGAFSFGVELKTAMLNSPVPFVEVKWWFDIGSAVRYRVHYYCTGDRCDIR